MIRQNDPNLDAILKMNGSYLLALFYISEKYTEQKYTVEDINYRFLKYVSLEWMESDGYVREAEKILHDLGVSCVQDSYQGNVCIPRWYGPSHDIEILFYMGNCIDVYAVSDGNGGVEWTSTPIGEKLYLVSKRLFTLGASHGRNIDLGNFDGTMAMGSVDSP